MSATDLLGLGFLIVVATFFIFPKLGDKFFDSIFVPFFARIASAIERFGNLSALKRISRWTTYILGWSLFLAICCIAKKIVGSLLPPLSLRDEVAILWVVSAVILYTVIGGIEDRLTEIETALKNMDSRVKNLR